MTKEQRKKLEEMRSRWLQDNQGPVLGSEGYLAGAEAAWEMATLAERKRIKKASVEVEHLESGTFQGCEEDTFMAGIKMGDDCLVISKKALNLKVTK